MVSAIRDVTSQKTGVSTWELQRVLGLGSYKTAWALLHKLRRAMVRPGRDRLRSLVEVDEKYWGDQEAGVVGRQTEANGLIIVAAEADGAGLGGLRMRRLPALTRAQAHGFIRAAVEPGSSMRADGLKVYPGLAGFVHDRQVQRQQPPGEHLLPRVHRAVFLLKRGRLPTHQGAIGHARLDYYLDEFTFRFNRGKSASRGKLFYRLVQQAVQLDPVPFVSLSRAKPSWLVVSSK